MAIESSKCPRCETTAKLRPRDFSDQALATLVAHGDLGKTLVGASVCDECYDDLRDVLIEHQKEIPTALPKAAPAKVKKAV